LQRPKARDLKAELVALSSASRAVVPVLQILVYVALT
jgi:hypothetical protein